MIILDTETTHLLRPSSADLKDQPHIVELGLVKLNDISMEEMDRIDTLVRPGIPLDEIEHAEITKLKNQDLELANTFQELHEQIVDFFLGERVLYAHNLPFDLGVIVCELRRFNAEYAFPYPPEQHDTVQETDALMGRRLKLTELYEHATGRKLDQKHRAISDVEALIEVVRWLRS